MSDNRNRPAESATSPSILEIRSLQKPYKNVFHIIAHITGFRQRSRIRNRKRNVQKPCEGLCKQSFTGAGGSDQQDIAFLKLYIRVRRQINALIMIVYSNR